MKFTPPAASESIGAALAAANAAMAQERLADAESSCLQVLSQQPQNIDAKLLLSDICCRSGAFPHAEELLRAVLGQDSNSVAALVRLARIKRMVQEHVEAMELCRRATALAPDDADAHCLLGLCLIDGWRLPEAIEALRRTVELRPGFGIAHERLGDALHLEGQDAESTAAYRQAIRLMPGKPSCYVNLGHHLLRLGTTQEAEALFAEANRAGSNSPPRLFELARAYEAVGDSDRTEATLRRLIQLAPAAKPPRRLLSQVLVGLGRFVEASAVLNETRNLFPNDPEEFLNLVYCGKQTEADRPLIEALERLEPGCGNPKIRAHLNYALGKAHDDLKDYSAAMRHFHLANRDALATARGLFRDRKVHSETIDGMISTLTPEFFEANRDVGSDSEEPVFIVGMPRSGTTLTDQIVSSHAAVGGVGELPFLYRLGLPLARTQAFDRSRLGALAESYLRRIRFSTPGESRITDKMPQNYMLAGLIHLMFPNARIIHCRRNPIDTCLSIYITDISMEFSHSLPDIAFSYREYLRLMAHWRKALPADRFFELDYEALVASPDPLKRRVIEFLGLPWDDAVSSHEANDRAITTASVWQVRQPIHTGSVERWRRYEPWIGELLNEFPEFA